MFFDRCHIISPRSVKLHYGLSTRNYRQNKVAAVEWVKRFLQANTDVILDPDPFEKTSKQDDLADALLLVLYYLDTYSNQLNK